MVLRVWGLVPRMGTPLECPDVPRGETPKRTPSPMIIEVKTIIPHQRANTPDPSIENPPFRAGRGHFICLLHLEYIALSLLEVFKPYLFDID
jgi:hypothetical protein